MKESNALIEQVLVIGASGKTGSRVIDRLKDILPETKIKAASRHSQVKFDWQVRETWFPALRGISHIYLTYYPDLAIPASVDDIQAFCDLAIKRNVKHITMLSGRGEPAAQQCEDILMSSGLNWNVVRASWFNQNFSDGFFKAFIEAGTIALPVEHVTEPFVDLDDVADVVAKTIVDASLQNQLIEVTGPELLSFKDISESFSALLGRDVHFQTVTQIEFDTMMREAHAPEDVIQLLGFLFTEVLDGRNQYLADGIQRVLGRPAKNFSAYIADNLNQFSSAVSA